MIMSLYVLGYCMKDRILCNLECTNIVAPYSSWFIIGKTQFLSHVVSFAPLAKAWYFAFVKDRATIGYHFEFYVMGHPLNWNTYLEVDHLVSRSFAQLAFVFLHSIFLLCNECRMQQFSVSILVFAIIGWGICG